MNKIVFALAASATLSAALPAAAQDVRQTKVTHADLDLGTPAGRAALDRRIGGALETVCGSYAGAINNEEREIARCRAQAVAAVRTQLAATRARGRVAVR